MTTLAEVRLWGRTIGAVTLAGDRDVAQFQYADEFVGSRIEVSPLMMPLARSVYAFPGLAPATFHGLPGMLADSLPDRFGHSLINAWLAGQGRTPDSFNAVERLCYIGMRGMGALEFAPATGPRARDAQRLEVDALVELASQVLAQRGDLHASFADSDRADAVRQILRVGTSAAGARAKALIAWNPATQEVRSGQAAVGQGFEHWLLKLDGVYGNRDKELDDPRGYGVIEYAYWLMAKAAGIEMSDCRLLEEHGRRHFMTRRFDRDARGGKLHMQSLGGLAHYDFNAAGGHGYEQVLMVIRRLDLPMAAVEQQFRRMAFNIVARNQDDHVKNIAFLMDQAGRWSLSPAFDVTWSFNPAGLWTARHQMTMNGKRDGFTLDDFRACGKVASLKRGRTEAIVDEVRAAVARWAEFADAAGVSPQWRDQVAATQRLDLA